MGFLLYSMCIRRRCSWVIPVPLPWAALWQAAAYVMQMPLFILIGRSDLSGRGAFSYDPGNIFQGNSREDESSGWPRSTIILNLCGWSETRVVAVFSVVTAVMCLIALLAFIRRRISHGITGKKGSGVSVSGKSGIGACCIFWQR